MLFQRARNLRSKSIVSIVCTDGHRMCAPNALSMGIAGAILDFDGEIIRRTLPSLFKIMAWTSKIHIISDKLYYDLTKYGTFVAVTVCFHSWYSNKSSYTATDILHCIFSKLQKITRFAPETVQERHLPLENVDPVCFRRSSTIISDELSVISR